MIIAIKVILTVIMIMLGALTPTLIITAFGFSFGTLAFTSTLSLVACILIWKYPAIFIIESFDNPDWGNNKRDIYGLKSELYKLINPQNFYTPYDFDKVACSNDLLQKLEKTDKLDVAKLKILRKEAEDNLKVKLNTEKFYNHLMKVLSPIRFSKKPDIFKLMNQYCQTISMNRENIDLIEDVLLQINNDIIIPFKDLRHTYITCLLLLLGFNGLHLIIILVMLT